VWASRPPHSAFKHEVIDDQLGPSSIKKGWPCAVFVFPVRVPSKNVTLFREPPSHGNSPPASWIMFGPAVRVNSFSFARKTPWRARKAHFLVRDYFVILDTGPPILRFFMWPASPEMRTPTPPRSLRPEKICQKLFPAECLPEGSFFPQFSFRMP